MTVVEYKYHFKLRLRESFTSNTTEWSVSITLTGQVRPGLRMTKCKYSDILTTLYILSWSDSEVPLKETNTITTHTQGLHI